MKKGPRENTQAVNPITNKNQFTSITASDACRVLHPHWRR